jgi:hypothetical protein
MGSFSRVFGRGTPLPRVALAGEQGDRRNLDHRPGVYAAMRAFAVVLLCMIALAGCAAPAPTIVVFAVPPAGWSMP